MTFFENCPGCLQNSRGNSVLSYKVCARGLIFRVVYAVLPAQRDAPQQPRHVLADIIHRVKPLLIAANLARLRAVDVVSVGGRNNGH